MRTSIGRTLVLALMVSVAVSTASNDLAVTHATTITYLDKDHLADPGCVGDSPFITLQCIRDKVDKIEQIYNQARDAVESARRSNTIGDGTKILLNQGIEKKWAAMKVKRAQLLAQLKAEADKNLDVHKHSAEEKKVRKNLEANAAKVLAEVRVDYKELAKSLAASFGLKAKLQTAAREDDLEEGEVSTHGTESQAPVQEMPGKVAASPAQAIFYVDARITL